MKASLKTDVAAEYSRKYQDAPTHTVARILYKENPSLFSTPETARTALRRVRGAMGARDRKYATDPRTPQESGYNLWEGLPEPIVQIREERSYNLLAKRVLIISDLHIPYHDLHALKGALQYGLDRNADAVILNGDIIDCHALSRYVQDPRERDFPREIDQTKQFLRALRSIFPNAEIVFNDGNHSERLETYFFTKAPELLGMSELFELDKILHFEELGIKRLKRTTHIKLGRLNVLHGHEFGKGGGINPARWLYLKAGKNALIGHFHRASAHTEQDMEGTLTSCWSTGALCQRQLYAPYAKWSTGFAWVEVDGKNFRVENRTFVDGEIY